MNKPILIPALAIAAVAAASLALPTTAAADTIRYQQTRVVVRDAHPRNAPVRPAHDAGHHYGDSRSHGPTRWEPPRHPHDNGHHYGHYYPVRSDYRPVQRYEYRNDYRPVVRYQPLHLDDLRLRFSYDLHF